MKPASKPYGAGLFIGALLMSSPVLGVLGTAYGMFRAFGALEDNGLNDQRELARGVGWALHSGTVGLVLCPVGAAIFILSLVMRARANRSSPPPLPATSAP